MKNIIKMLCLTFTLAFTASSYAEEPLKVGFVYVSSTGEAGWTHTHDQARLNLEKVFGDKVKTTFIENVAEGPDAERVITQLAQSGHKLIFTTSFGFMNPTLKVAKRFPDVKFEHATGYKRADNVSTYFDRIYEARYLTGVVAGYMSKTNVIGYIGAFPIPEVVRGINAFTLGARSVNPDIKVKVVWVNTWFDPAKEREATNSLIDQKADVITFHTDSPAPVQAAEDAGIYAIAYHSDMSQYGPKAQLTAAIHDWNDYYVKEVQSVIDGTWKSKDVWEGIASGMTKIAPFNASVPKDVADKVLALQSDIVSGKLHPFAGPIKDQSGKLVVPEGSVISDADLLRMDYYVEGVDGKLK